MKGKYKHSEETKRKMSESKKGKNNPMWGKERFDFRGEKHPRYGKKYPHNEETKQKISETLKRMGTRPPTLRGSKNPGWKGGITSLVRLIRKCFKYRQWRSDVFTRDDFTCQDCKKREYYLYAHHNIKSFPQIIEEHKIKTLDEAIDCEELWNINNGITLCKNCHIKTYDEN